MTEKHCKNCGDKLSIKGPGGHNRLWCDDPECVAAKKEYFRVKAASRMREKREVGPKKDMPEPEPNGYQCQYNGCGKPLTGNYYRWCPEHHKRVTRSAGRIDGDHIYFHTDVDMESEWKRA